MFQKILKKSTRKVIYNSGIYIIIVTLFTIFAGGQAQAQQFLWQPSAGLYSPYQYGQRNLGPLYGIPFGYPFPIFSPSIRRSPVLGDGYGRNWNSGNLRLAIPAPRPVIRQAAATVTILITQGPTQALLVYNPTILFGPSATTIIPTALTLPALLSGKPLIFGTAPLTSSNISIFNYVANNLLLPSGIALYIFP